MATSNVIFSVECHVCSGADSTTGRLKANLRNAMFAKRIPNPKGSGNCNSKASTSTCTGEVCVKDVVTYKFKYRFSIYYFHTYTKYCGKNTTAQLPNSCVQTGNQAVTEDYVATPNRCICNDKQYCNAKDLVAARLKLQSQD
ncbi:unnamed protein product, partial [Mesorhabditis belari]|uniref:Uncharacterized protein n=1 Tax=Mesorhabditis belari TaxID=2138241 RepID=A0AAF3F042_9BILA